MLQFCVNMAALILLIFLFSLQSLKFFANQKWQKVSELQLELVRSASSLYWKCLKRLKFLITFCFAGERA